MLSSLNNYNLKMVFSISLLCVIVFCGTAVAQDHGIDASEWKFESQRKEISPVGFIDSTVTYEGKPTLVLAGGGKEYSNGHWYTIRNVEPGAYVQFRANFIAINVEEPERSVLARIIWQDGKGERIGTPEYPASFPAKSNGSWDSIRQSYKIPKDARTARIELVYRWDANGIVHFAGTSLEKATAPVSRIVKVAAIHHRPRDSKSSRENLVQFSKLIAKAGVRKLILFVFPKASLWLAPPMIICRPVNRFRGQLQTTWDKLPANIIYILLRASLKKKAISFIIQLS